MATGWDNQIKRGSRGGCVGAEGLGSGGPSWTGRCRAYVGKGGGSIRRCGGEVSEGQYGVHRSSRGSCAALAKSLLHL